MKIRFPLKNTNGINGRGSLQCLGLDTSEILTFHLFGDNAEFLHLWYRDKPDPLLVAEKDIGAEYFADLLTLICSEFQHIDDAKPRIALLADLRQPLNIDQ